MALPLEKLPIAAIGRVGAHFSRGSSEGEIRRRFGAPGQQDRLCALTVRSLGAGKQQLDREYCGGREQPGVQSSVNVRNITNGECTKAV